MFIIYFFAYGNAYAYKTYEYIWILAYNQFLSLNVDLGD